MTPTLCNLPSHAYQPPHRVNGMACTECLRGWRDCVGEFGERYRTGCPGCGSRYWISTRIDREVQRR